MRRWSELDILRINWDGPLDGPYDRMCATGHAVVVVTVTLTAAVVAGTVAGIWRLVHRKD